MPMQVRQPSAMPGKDAYDAAEYDAPRKCIPQHADNAGLLQYVHEPPQVRLVGILESEDLCAQARRARLLAAARRQLFHHVVWLSCRPLVLSGRCVAGPSSHSRPVEHAAVNTCYFCYESESHVSSLVSSYYYKLNIPQESNKFFIFVLVLVLALFIFIYLYTALSHLHLRA